MTDEEAEELERQENLLKIKMAQTSEKVKEWGMQTGLERLLHAELRTAKWHEDKNKPHVSEIMVFFKTLPIALLFMLCVIGASYTHFEDAKAIPGNLYSLAQFHPIVFPMATSSSMVEARVQIMSSTASGLAMAEEGGGHRRSRRSKTVWTTPSVYPRNSRGGSSLRADEPAPTTTDQPDGVALANATDMEHEAAPESSVSFFLTLVTGPRRSLSLKLSDTRVYEPQIRARLGTTALFGRFRRDWGQREQRDGARGRARVVGELLEREIFIDNLLVR